MSGRILGRFSLDYHNFCKKNPIRVCSIRVICNKKTDTCKTGKNFYSNTVNGSKKYFQEFHCLERIGLRCHSELYAIRNYSKKKNKREVIEESDSDEDDDLLDKLDKNAKVMKTSVSSMRVDALIKSGLALSRNKIDTLFYEGRLRLNGSKITKKSQRLNVGDEVDVIKGVNPKNDNLLNISRIEVLSAAADKEEDAISVKIRRIKQLNIENYEKHPWIEVTE